MKMNALNTPIFHVPFLVSPYPLCIAWKHSTAGAYSILKTTTCLCKHTHDVGFWWLNNGKPDTLEACNGTPLGRICMELKVKCTNGNCVRQLLHGNVLQVETGSQLAKLQRQIYTKCASFKSGKAASKVAVLKQYSNMTHG